MAIIIRVLSYPCQVIDYWHEIAENWIVVFFMVHVWLIARNSYHAGTQYDVFFAT